VEGMVVEAATVEMALQFGVVGEVPGEVEVNLSPELSFMYAELVVEKNSSVLSLMI
jgi:hypothetical protein